jgi:predicted Zn-dependent protease
MIDLMQNQNFRKTPLLVLFLGLLVLGGAYAGVREYLSLRQSRLIKQARKYFAKSDISRAQLCLRSALGHDPKDLDACRLMAQLAEATRSSSALLWRSRVVESNPHSLDDRLALAQTALVLHDYPSAASALDGVRPDDQKTAAYQEMAGDVAIAAKHFVESESHFLEAARLDPTNINTQLNLAVARLLGTNAIALAEARTTLRLIATNCTNPAFRHKALRTLAVDAFHWKQMDAALALTKELLRQTNAAFDDELLRLDALQQTRDAEFQPALAACQREAAQNPTNLYELATWETLKISPAGALAWLRSLPAPVQTNQPAALLLAECSMDVRDWPGLQTFLEHQNWGDLEFIRHAYLASSFRGQNLVSSSKAQWEQALKLANGKKADVDRKSHLIMLLRLAAQWNWQSEGEDILWSIVNNYPNEKWALSSLAKALFVDGRTRSLMQLFSQEAKRTPSDLAAKNNVAMTALLLDAQELKPQELAREVYQKQPTNSAYVATYALALYLRTNNAAALKVLEQLNPKELEKPSISGCYGLVLLANGNATKARKYLDLTSKETLLPEERRLIEKARSGI